MNKDKSGIKLPEAIKIAVKAFKVSLRTKTRASLAISIFGFVIAFLPMVISVALRKLVDTIQSIYVSDSSDISEALMIFLFLSALYIIQTAFSFAQNYYAADDKARIQKYIKETIISCACSVKYKYIENYGDFREKITFAGTQAGQRVAGSIQTIVVWAQTLITFVSIVYLLIEVNVWIVVILMVTCIPAVILSAIQKDEDYRRNVKWMKEGAMVLHYSYLAASDMAINEIRFFGLYDYIKNRWRNLADKYIDIKNRMTGKHVLYNSIADLLRNSVYIIVLLIAAREIYVNPVIGLGTFMLVFTLSGQLQEVTAKLLISATQFFSDINYMKDFFELDHLEREAAEESASPLSSVDIEFCNVDFKYPNSDKEVLHGLNVKIKQGEKIAIVGENGSGKTTFINLLCGMYEPDNGDVKYNGIDIRKHLASVRRSISVVFQDFARYEATIRENISVSDKARLADDQAIYDLTRLTGAFDFIDSQPDKLDEIVGTFSRKGNNLSGGQWQKIAISRALYRDNARVLVLDEPTAALDPMAEASLYREFAALTGDKTTILVSHRLGITSVVDRILVFDNGKIVEDGSHKELMNNNGLYARMYKAQAQWYMD